ncbi:hypothetical protein CDIK_1147 [Cucumispora dikerogammari]|nr:hypothetical protein CDIK_1147 [Cucumispora dikerogammari]
MSFRSLTPYSISCSNTILSISTNVTSKANEPTSPSMETPTPNTTNSIKIRTQIIVQFSIPYIIGGDDFGNLFYTPLHNINLKRKKIHTDFIRRIYFYTLPNDTGVIVTCSDDGKIICYEIYEENELKFKFLFEIDFKIGINDFCSFTSPILYENSAEEFQIKGNFLNIQKEVLKVFLEKNLLVATFFGVRVFNESNKKLMKNFPNPTYSMVKISDTTYALGTDIGVSLIELSYPSFLISIIKVYEIGTTYKILLIENKLYCCSTDVYEIHISNQSVRKLNLSNLNKNSFLDLAIKRKVYSQATMQFVDILMAINENELFCVPIKTEEFILTENQKLFCFKENRMLLRCKELKFNEQRLVLQIDDSLEPVKVKITDQIFINNKVYSLLGRDITDSQTGQNQETKQSKYTFVKKPQMSFETEDFSVFLIEKIAYCFFKGDMILFTTCLELHSLNGDFLIKREQGWYFLNLSIVNEQKDSIRNNLNGKKELFECLDLRKKNDFLYIGKFFIYLVETKLNAFALISVKQKLGLLNKDFNGLKIEEYSNAFTYELQVLNILRNFFIYKQEFSGEICNTYLIERLILSTDGKVKEELKKLLFQVSKRDSFLFAKILKYGNAFFAEMFLRKPDLSISYPFSFSGDLDEIRNTKVKTEALKPVFQKYLIEKDFKNSLRIGEEIGIKEDLRNVLMVLSEEDSNLYFIYIGTIL